MIYLEGTCDVCKQKIYDIYDPALGIIDYGFTSDGRFFTWIRHIGGQLPGCDIYSSRVYEVKRFEKFFYQQVGSVGVYWPIYGK